MKTFNDTIQFNEALINFNGGSVLSADFNDSISRTESFNKGVIKTLSDIIDLIDGSAKNFIRTFTEYLHKNDLTAQKAVIKTFSETLSKAENLVKSTVKTLSDSLTKSDSVLKGMVKNLSDSLTKTEIFSRVVGYTRSFSDSLVKTEKLRRYLNGVELIWTKIVHTLSTVWDKRVKPNTSWEKRTKPTTNWTKRDKPWD